MPRPCIQGRPSKYDPAICDRILDYFNPTRVLSKVTVTAEGEIALVDFPTMAGFAFREGVDRKTLHNWRNAHLEFFHAYARAREGYESILITAGLYGLVSPTFAALTTKNTLGWRN